MTSDEMERRLDELLQSQFNGSIEDDGFCDRVMLQLPERPRRQHWPLVTGLTLGLLAGCASLVPAPIVMDAWRDWNQGDLSASLLTLLATMLAMAIMTAAWCAAEAGDDLFAGQPLSLRSQTRS